MPALAKQTRMYTRGLQRIFSRVYGFKNNDDSPLPGGVTEGNSLPPKDYIDLLEDDICMALVTTTIDGSDAVNPEPHVYEVDFHDHEYLSDVVGTTGNAVWSQNLESVVSYSNITKHSAPLTEKKIVWVNPTAPVAAPNDNYKEVMFDCKDVVFESVPPNAPKSEAVVLYKRVLLDPSGNQNDPLNINLDESPVIAYFGGDSVALDPNGSDVNLVISGNGLIRWGVGYAPLTP